MVQPLLSSSLGIVPGVGLDNTKQMLYAISVAKAQQQPLVFPEGIFEHSDILKLSGVQIYGAGDNTIFYARNKKRSAIFLEDSGSVIAKLKLSGPTLVPITDRESTRESCRVVAMGATNFLIQNITVDQCAGASIRADKSANGTIEGNRVRNSLADSIHLTDGSSYINILGNTIKDSWDDGIACVSYRDQPTMVNHIKASGNKIYTNQGGRNMSIVGGSFIEYENNFLDTNLKAAGMYLAQEIPYHTYGCHNILIEHNTIRNCGVLPPKEHNAIMCFSDGEEQNSDILIQRNLILQQISGIGGIRVFGPFTGVNVKQNVVKATPEYSLVSGVILEAYTEGSVGVY